MKCNLCTHLIMEIDTDSTRNNLLSLTVIRTVLFAQLKQAILAHQLQVITTWY